MTDLLYEKKKQKLLESMQQYAKKDLLIAFSGGVDSSLILKLACEAAKTAGQEAFAFGEEQTPRVYAAIARTRLHPMGEVEYAEQIATDAGAIFLIIEVDEMEQANIKDNPVDRCYRCKKTIFSGLLLKARELSVETVLEGTNEDDLHVYRPGIRALRELDIKSPLAEAGFTKEEVRRLAAEYGISSADKPSMPCLATRFPYGTRLSYEDMKRVDQGEKILRAMGFYNVRIRVHGDIARIEVDAEHLTDLLPKREEIIASLKKLGYSYITVDLEGFRSGSMDIHIVRGGAI